MKMGELIYKLETIAAARRELDRARKDRGLYMKDGVDRRNAQGSLDSCERTLARLLAEEIVL